jgi:hypothetical protein
MCGFAVKGSGIQSFRNDKKGWEIISQQMSGAATGPEWGMKR